MKTASRVTLTLAGATALLAIWQPVGAWWQWAITALLLLLIGAGLHGNNTPPETYNPRTGHLDGELLPEDVAREFTGNSAGPHLRITTEGLSPEEVAEKFDQHAARQAALYNNGRTMPPAARTVNDTDQPEQIHRPSRPTYGKPNQENDQR